MLIDASLLLVLVLLNGVFAMSEIAIVSSRRARLLQLAESGRAGARSALNLVSEPTRFLSSVQVGITTIGILSGAIGEASIARRLIPLFESVPYLTDYADGLSLALTVIVLSYVSLILGELVPKRVALMHPETIASRIARPMQIVATVGRPVVHLLSVSTDTILRFFRVSHVKPPSATADEIRLLLEQGTEEGTLESAEREMMTNVLKLDQRHVGAVLTPRSDVVFVELRDAPEINHEKLRQETHTVLPLCDGGLDNVVGLLQKRKVLAYLLDGHPLDLKALADPPLFVPETMTLMHLLEEFKRRGLPLALVVDEFGGVDGIVSLGDVISSIVGDFPPESGGEPEVVRREDGSWLFDGAVDLDTVLRTLDDAGIVRDEERQHYHTLGGLAMAALGRVPRIGDVFERAGFRFEIVDMDGNRVDRVLVSSPNQGRSSHQARR